MTKEHKEFISLLNSGLKAGQIAKACSDLDLRLSVFGWSTYAVEDGVMKLHYCHRGEEFTDVIRSVEELSFFDPEWVGDFEYSQSITPDMIMALKGLKTVNRQNMTKERKFDNLSAEKKAEIWACYAQYQTQHAPCCGCEDCMNFIYPSEVTDEMLEEVLRDSPNYFLTVAGEIELPDD